MEHIHNETVLAFLKAHEDMPGVKRFIQEQDKQVKALNRELGTRYEGYLEYLDENIGDDASFTLEELKALLAPAFLVRLNKEEKAEYSYEEFEVSLDELVKPVYIKDEGDFFTVWGKEGRIDIPVRLLGKFREFLREHRVQFEDEYGG
ncbi:MAG: hypothetical protein WBF96_12070 [Phycisphaerae bacterium]